jgi:hypothetical protein
LVLFFSVVTDVQQEKFFNSINQIVINTPSVFVTDADKQLTIDDIRTTNSYCINLLISFDDIPFVFFCVLDFDVYIVSLLVWTLSSKKFTSIQENTIAVLANLYGELSLRWPAVFRIFITELIDTLNGLLFIILNSLKIIKKIFKIDTIKYDVTIERCFIEFNCSGDISSFQINLM